MFTTPFNNCVDDDDDNHKRRGMLGYYYLDDAQQHQDFQKRVFLNGKLEANSNLNNKKKQAKTYGNENYECFSSYYYYFKDILHNKP